MNILLHTFNQKSLRWGGHKLQRQDLNIYLKMRKEIKRFAVIEFYGETSWNLLDIAANIGAIIYGINKENLTLSKNLI